MSLVIHLSPEIEERLRIEAAREGVAVEQYAQRLLEDRATPADGPFHAERTREEWLREFNRWADAHDPGLAPFSDDGLRRESFYGERG